MISVEIGGTKLPLDQATERWIADLVNRKYAGGKAICVRVFVHTADVNLILSTPDCGANAGGTRQPNPKEARIFELWERRRLNRADYCAGEVIAFLKQLTSYI
jgi:hypothetical protein